jgi:hypothetical protein
MSWRAIVVLAGVLSAAGCRSKAAPAGSPETFALAFVEAARAGTPGSMWLDEDLMQRLRKTQLARLSARGARTEQLRQVPKPAAPWEGESERARSAAALRTRLQGPCRAARDPDGAGQRLRALRAPVGGIEEASRAEIDALVAELKDALVVRVQCARGAAGLLLVPRREDGDGWRIVDLFPVGD